jgi:hypothetical protein
MSEKKVCNSTKKYVNNIEKYVTAYGVCQIKPDFSDACARAYGSGPERFFVALGLAARWRTFRTQRYSKARPLRAAAARPQALLLRHSKIATVVREEWSPQPRVTQSHSIFNSNKQYIPQALSPTGALLLFHDVRLFDPERRQCVKPLGRVWGPFGV